MNVNNEGVVIVKKGVSVVDKVLLDLSLTKITYPHPNDRYTLFLFASRDIQSHPSLNRAFSIDKQTRKSFCVVKDPHLPEYLHLWVFVADEDEDGLLTQTPLGTAKVKFKELLLLHNKELEFLDIEGNIQAKGSVKALTSIKSAKFAADSTPLGEELLQEIYKAYEQVQYNHDQRFVYIDTHIGKIPIIGFPLLATQQKVHPLHAAKLLENLRHVCAPLASNELDLIGEILTVTPRCLMYQPDQIRTANGMKSTDQWSSLGCFPSLALAGFDCEDAAKLILEYFFLFKHTKLPKGYEKLQKLQDLLQHYTGYLCLGQLNLKEGATPHAYVVLLDKDFLISHQSRYPTLVLEGTNYTGSLWNKTGFVEDQKTLLEEYNKLDSGIDSDKKSRIVRIKMPQSEVERSRLYGPVSALISAEPSEHWLVGSEKNGFVLGVEPEQLFYCDPSVARRLIVSSEQVTNLTETLKEFPPVQFPFAPDDSQPPFTRFTYSQRACDPSEKPLKIGPVIGIDLMGARLQFSRSQ